MNTYLILSWAFFLISVICALMITSLKHPLTRKYRKVLISTAVSGIILGVGTWFMPLLLRNVNPIQSKKVALGKLPVTSWEEPVENPITRLEGATEELPWLADLPDHLKIKFKFKLKLDHDFKAIITVQENELVYLDSQGDLRGFDPYSALNHWKIETRFRNIRSIVIGPKRLFVLDYPKDEDLRISCFDTQSPSILWQRLIPESKVGEALFDFETQSLVISTASNGVWSLKSKTGEILWKRPEIYSNTVPIMAQNRILIFEPPVGKKVGTWYFLDPLTGSVLQKQNHVYPEMAAFIPTETGIENQVLSRVNLLQYFLFHPSDLSVLWSQTSSDPILKIMVTGNSDFLVAYENRILEKRDLKTGDLIWQKKMNQLELESLSTDSKHQLLFSPTSDADHRDGIGFYDLLSGNYLFTLQLQDPIQGLTFFGDWLYVASESFIWAFQRENEISSKPTPPGP